MIRPADARARPSGRAWGTKPEVVDRTQAVPKARQTGLGRDACRGRRAGALAGAARTIEIATDAAAVEVLAYAGNRASSSGYVVTRPTW